MRPPFETRRIRRRGGAAEVCALKTTPSSLPFPFGRRRCKKSRQVNVKKRVSALHSIADSRGSGGRKLVFLPFFFFTPWGFGDSLSFRSLFRLQSVSVRTFDNARSSRAGPLSARRGAVVDAGR